MPTPLLIEHAIELPVEPGEAHRALLEIGATEHEDGTYSVENADDPSVDGFLTVRISPNDEGTTHVDIAAGNPLRLPFFHSIVSSVVGIQYQQAIDHVVERLEAQCEGRDAAEVKTPRRNPLLPPVPYTRAQAVGLSTAGFAVAIATFGQAIVAQYSKGIQETFLAHTDHPDTKLSIMLAVIRGGAFIALFAGMLSDRIGRRRLILIALLGLSASSLLTALAPEPISFSIFQTSARGFSLAIVFAGSVIALEEAPERARGFATSMLALAGGFGFTFAVVLLPFAGKHGRWRFVFILSALFGILTLRVGKFLKESPRFQKVAHETIRRGRITEVLGRHYRRRFFILAGIAFLTNILTAPSSTYTNNYLTENHGFSYSRILLWRVVTTSYTGLIGLAIAGILIERFGRKPTAFVALSVGGLVRLAFYLLGGPILWIASAIGDMAFACGFIAIATQNVELFPTEARGTSVGMVNIVGVCGSIFGILVAGVISDNYGGWGHALAFCTIPTLIAAVVLVPFLPETRGRDLDEISPSEA